MADSYTPNLGLTLMENGTHNNTWNDEYLSNDQRIDAKFGDVTTINSTGGTQVLTGTQERVNVVKVTGTLVSNLAVEFSGVGGAWVIQNDTTGAFALTVRKTGQTGVGINQGTKSLVYYNGTDIATLSADTAANLGLGTGDSPQFLGVNVGHASDTTVTRASAGDIQVAGKRLFRVGGTDVPVADGGTGGSTATEAYANIAPSRACSFFAHKNGTGQTISSTAATLVTFGTETYDVGGKLASSRWTPVAGTALLICQLTLGGLSASEVIGFSIYKNGTLLLTEPVTAPAAGGNFTVRIMGIVQTNGTDYFEVFLDSTSDASYTVAGNADRTFFCGSML